MALQTHELPLADPLTRESMRRHVRHLVLTRLRLGLELPERRSNTEHRRLYLICQAIYWLLIPGLLILLAMGFAPRPVEELPPGGFIRMFLRIGIILVLGFSLTHSVRYLFRRWGWKRLDWSPLLPRLFGIAVVLAGVLATAHLGLDVLVGRETWAATLTPNMMFFVRWMQGMMTFTPWLFAYFFYHFSDRLSRSEFERLRLAASAKEAELRALKSQVNPHFIFNSLNSLRALIEEDPARARGAVTRLAGLLRYALQSGQLETVPLEDELHIINDYLALEQVRFEERLRVRLDVAPDTLALPVPPLLLQTLVENAVKYGIAPRPEGGEITIRTWREGDTLRLEVGNPGSLAPTVPGEDGSTGLGIKNAAERLRLLFGDGASLQLHSAPSDGVRAEVTIPLLPSGPTPSATASFWVKKLRCESRPGPTA